MYVRSAAARVLPSRRIPRRRGMGDSITAQDIGCTFDATTGLMLDPLGLLCSAGTWITKSDRPISDAIYSAAQGVSNTVLNTVGIPITESQLQNQIGICQENARRAGANVSPEVLQAQLEQCARDVRAAGGQADQVPSSIPWTAIAVIAALGVGAFAMSRL